MLLLLASPLIVCYSSESDAVISVADWKDYDTGVYFDTYNECYYVDNAVHISDLNAVIPLPVNSYDSFEAYYLSYNALAREGGGYFSYYPSKVTLTTGDSFTKIATLFEDGHYVNLELCVGDTYYLMVLIYDTPAPITKYDVTGTVVAGAISMTAVRASDATADLENPLFYVIAHYGDGKFISMYVPAAVAADGTLALSNMGVSTLGLVDVMVGVVGEVPSDAPTVFYGETVLTASA